MSEFESEKKDQQLADGAKPAAGSVMSASGNGNKNRSAPVGARAARADAFRPHGNGNEGSPDARPEQAPNNRLQPTRALGAGAYSLVGWAGPKRS